MTPQTFLKKLRWMSWLQGLSLLAALFFMGTYAVNQLSRHPQEAISLMQQGEKLQTLADNQLTHLDDLILTGLEETFQSLSALVAIIAPAFQIADSLGTAKDQFNQLENKRARLQALIIDELRPTSYGITTDLAYLLNAIDTKQAGPELHTILSLRYAYNLSGHHLASFSVGFQGQGLVRAQEIIEEALKTLDTFMKTQEAGRKFATLQSLYTHLSDYRGVIKEALETHADLMQTQAFFKKQVSFFISKLASYTAGLAGVDMSWILDGVVILGCALFLFIMGHVKTIFLIRRYDAYMRNLRDMLRRARERNQLLLSQGRSFPPAEPSPCEAPTQPKGIVVAGFSLSTIAQEMHMLVEKTDQLTKTIHTHGSSPH